MADINIYDSITCSEVSDLDVPAVVDSYSNSNGDTAFLVNGAVETDIVQCVAQAFSCTSTTKILGASFWLKRTDTGVTGTAVVRFYPHTGTFGSTGIPGEEYSWEQDGFDVSSLSTLAYTKVTFHYVNYGDSETYPALSLSAGNYFVGLEYSEAATGGVQCLVDESSPSHAGNAASRQNIESEWVWQAETFDACFEVLGEEGGSTEINVFNTNAAYCSVTENISIELAGTKAIDCTSAIAVGEEIGAILSVPILIFSGCSTTEEIILSIISGNFGTRELPLVYTPVASLSASMGERWEIAERGPVVSCSGMFGAVADDKCPVTTGEGSLISYVVFNLNKLSPVTSVTGIFGSSVEGTVYATACESVSYSNWLGVAGNGPTVVCSGSLFEEGGFNLNKKLPFPFITARCYGEGIAFSATAPVGYGSGITLVSVPAMELSATAPCAKVDFDFMLIYDGGITVIANSPIGTMLADTGEGDTDSAELSYVSRFTSYTLEYVR